MIGKGADVKSAANWLMSDIAAYLKNEELSISDVKLTPQELAELIAAIKDETISGKIGKQVSSVSVVYHLFALDQCDLSPVCCRYCLSYWPKVELFKE